MTERQRRNDINTHPCTQTHAHTHTHTNTTLRGADVTDANLNYFMQIVSLSPEKTASREVERDRVMKGEREREEV